MRFSTALSALLIAGVVATTLGAAFDAAADSSSVGVSVISNRDPGHFGDPKNTKYELNGAHTFDDGLILGVHSNLPTRPSVIGPVKI